MKSLILDTNLLCLLIAGLADRGMIERHKRLRVYTEDDFDLLSSVVSRFSILLTCPHILTETSNLLRLAPESVWLAIHASFKRFVLEAREYTVPGVTVVHDMNFPRLGFADPAILLTMDHDAVLITDDLDLYLAAESARASVINYNYLRERAVQISDYL